MTSVGLSVMDVEQVLHMNGGDGEASYANNSLPQRTVISRTKPVIQEAVLSLCSMAMPKSLAIADLGCSSGPNSLLAMTMILDAIHESCHRLGRSSLPEFLVFLNDLPGNDFNTIFKGIPSFYKRLQEEKGVEFGPCFIAALPGSFYGRLFPSESLHFIYSANSLHWLSQVPPELQSAVPNEGNIGLAKNSPPKVHEAYLKQFQGDFRVFLESRSQEIVPGGCMILALIGRKTKDPFSKECHHYWDDLARAFRGMVSEGIVEEAKLDSFNMPYYEPHIEELREVIQAEGSFDIERLEEDYLKSNLDDMKGGGMLITENVLANCVRAVTEPILVSHFGQAIMDTLFQRFEKILYERRRGEELMALLEQMDEIGAEVSVGDGNACVYGLNEIPLSTNLS